MASIGLPSTARTQRRRIDFRVPDFFPPIFSWLIHNFFAIIYALVIFNFTFKFFNEFVPKPETDLKAFGLISSDDVFKFGLPLFLIFLELIAVQIAISGWRYIFGASRLHSGQAALSKWPILALSFVFLGLQLLPMIGFYWDVRNDKFEQEVTRLYETEPGQIEAAFLASQSHIESRRGPLLDQKDQIQGELDRTESAIRALDSSNLRLIAPGQFAYQQDQLYQQRERLFERGLQLNESLDTLDQEVVAASDERTSSLARLDATVLPDGSLDYIIRTFWHSDALFTGLISLIFPIIILAAGYYMASHQTDLDEVPSMDPQSAIRIAEALPDAYQELYASELAEALASQLAKWKVDKQGVMLVTNLMHENGHQERALHWFATVSEIIGQSNLNVNARTKVLDRLQEELLRP